MTNENAAQRRQSQAFELERPDIILSSNVECTKSLCMWLLIDLIVQGCRSVARDPGLWGVVGSSMM
jgi:hypothetical protein